MSSINTSKDSRRFLRPVERQERLRRNDPHLTARRDHRCGLAGDADLRPGWNLVERDVVEVRTDRIELR
jgi:hypothetical protein